MSKIGKQPIVIPNEVSIVFENHVITAKGPKGVLINNLPDEINVKIEGQTILISNIGDTSKDKQARALWGTWRAIISNMVMGVMNGFSKVLEYKGVGYKAVVEGKDLVLSLGFSHPIKMPAPEGISFGVDKNTIIVNGLDKELVGQTAARIKNFRPPEPYKGAGIKYINETIHRKEGKKSVSAGF
jgi:large subunit ribosomal protein L6